MSIYSPQIYLQDWRAVESPRNWIIRKKILVISPETALPVSRHCELPEYQSLHMSFPADEHRGSKSTDIVFSTTMLYLLATTCIQYHLFRIEYHRSKF
jgi:hypothetical protein